MNLHALFADHPEWLGHGDLILQPPQAAEIAHDFPEAAGTEICQRADTPTRFGVTRGAIYVLARRRGQSHRFAEMAALNRPPRADTDDVQFSGIPRVGEQSGDRYMAGILAKANARGFTPPADAVYHSGLARFAGDHEAFVTPDMGRAYIRSLCTARGWAAEGDVNVAARAPERDPLDNAVPLAEDLVDRSIGQLVRRDPHLKKHSRKELREMAIAKYGPSS